MTDLLARLSVAEAGSRELDARVEVAVRLVEAGRTGLAREHWAKWEPCRDGYVQDPHTRYASNPFTTSLDAALALAERVLGRVHARILLAKTVGCSLRGDEPVGPGIAKALCIAILRAAIATATRNSGDEG